MTEKQRTKLLEKYQDMPYLDIISSQNEIKIASLFQFSEGVAQIHQFVRACAAFGCTVHFENENITVTPEDDLSRTTTTLSVYGLLAVNGQLKSDFMSYLVKLSTGEYKSDVIQIL